MRNLKILLLNLFIAGCAYFENGATTKIRLGREGSQKIYLNGSELRDSTSEIEILNQNKYRIKIEDGENVREETVEQKINSTAYQSLIIWPYIFVDLNLGSHLKVNDGKYYKVIGRGQELSDDCEENGRQVLEKSIKNTWIYFMGGSMLALVGAGYAEQSHPMIMVQIPLSIGAFGGLVGAGYSVYKTGSKTREIRKCIEGRIDRQHIFAANDTVPQKKQ
ncbi:MAG: hypothetical protein JWP91_855 [Fibrobacteres bacterium]|nr:hypothetical protein [Fibrobacterota bacterium]